MRISGLRVFAAFGISCGWLITAFLAFAFMPNLYIYPERPLQWIGTFLYLSFAWPRSIFDRLFSPSDCPGSYETLDGCSDPELVYIATIVTLLSTYTVLFYAILTIIVKKHYRGAANER